jgi:hypothetical protein
MALDEVDTRCISLNKIEFKYSDVLGKAGAQKIMTWNYLHYRGIKTTGSEDFKVFSKEFRDIVFRPCANYEPEGWC